MSPITQPAAEDMLADFRLQASGNPAAAMQRLIERLRRVDPPGTLWEQLAARLLAQGDAVSAGVLLEQGLQLYPDMRELHYLMGNALRMQDKKEAAERELRAVLAMDPEHAGATASLAFLLREQGRMDEAVKVMRAGWSHAHADPEETRRVATFLAQCGRHEEALEICMQVLAAHADANLYALSGTLAMTLGRFAQASCDLRRAVHMNPELATAWLWLAMAHKFKTLDDPDLHALEAVAAKQPAASDVRICAGFALGKAYDDLADIPAAARELRQANSVMAERVNWRVEAWHEFVAAKLDEVPPGAVARSADDFIPVFVVGLPRTGTTLVSTLLSRHPRVRNRGELGWLAALSEQGAPRHYPTAFLARAAELYGAQLRQDDGPVRCYIDKNPFNFRFLGLAASLFPGARVIHCRRDQRDCALSTWRQYFAGGDAGYTYRFSDIAEVARGHDQLMAHWHATLDLPIFDLEYERLVANPEETVASLMQFLELESAELLNATRISCETGVIGTASLWQARQSVYSSSVGRWRGYAEYLPEMLEAFPLERLGATRD